MPDELARNLDEEEAVAVRIAQDDVRWLWIRDADVRRDQAGAPRADATDLRVDIHAELAQSRVSAGDVARREGAAHHVACARSAFAAGHERQRNRRVGRGDLDPPSTAVACGHALGESELAHEAGECALLVGGGDEDRTNLIDHGASLPCAGGSWVSR